MAKMQKDQERYSIPFVVHSSYKLRMHFLFLFFIILFMGSSFLLLDNLGIKLLSFTLGLFFLYCWVYMGILKKAFLELTEDGILLKTVSIMKKIKWIDMANVQTFCLQRNSYIGIITNEKLQKRKDNFLTSLSEAFGGGYSLSIPLASFSSIDPQILYSTIFYTTQEKMQPEEPQEDNANDIVKEEKKETKLAGNPIRALFKAFIVSFTIGIIYGFSIYKFNANLLMIPLLGIVGILYAFYKSYQKNDLNIIIRIVLGFLCAMQFYVASLVFLFLLNLDYAEMNGAWRTIADCGIYIFVHPEEFAVYYTSAAICFVFGTFQNYSSKTTRRIQKVFMRKQNGFIIKKEKRYTSVFLIDYADYHENGDKKILSIAPNTCLIEKEKSKILAFYIPEQLIEEFNINISKVERTIVNGEIYYKLNLGGHAEQLPYGYMCNLILSKDRQAELLQLEMD